MAISLFSITISTQNFWHYSLRKYVFNSGVNMAYYPLSNSSSVERVDICSHNVSYEGKDYFGANIKNARFFGAFSTR
jgi:hypothetical protein